MQAAASVAYLHCGKANGMGVPLLHRDLKVREPKSAEACLLGHLPVSDDEADTRVSLKSRSLSLL